jgi:tetratricopeptide (TPR) repeat protein
MLPGDITRAEVIEQLQRILSSSRFSRKISQSDYLKFLAETSIELQAHEWITEDTVGRALVKPNYDARLDSAARVMIGKVRRNVIEYYRNEGRYDPIVIAFPPVVDKKTKVPSGMQYTPGFSRNDRTALLQHLNLGHYFLRNSFWSKLQNAHDHFNAVLKEHPADPAALLGVAEGLLGDALGLHPEHRQLVLGYIVENYLNPVLQADPEDWHAHVVMGYVKFHQGDADGAEEEFNKAFDLDFEAMSSHPYVLQVLIDDGEWETAVKCAYRYAAENPHEVFAQEIYCMCLYRYGNYADAEAMALHAISMDMNARNANLFLYAVYVKTGRKAEAQKQLERCRQIIPPEDVTEFILRAVTPPRYA